MPIGTRSNGGPRSGGAHAAARVLPALAAGIALLAGCSSGLHCPAGTVKYGNTCKAVEDLGPQEDVLVPEIVASEDAGADAPSDLATEADAPAGDADAAGPDGTVGDAAPFDAWPAGVVGKACKKSTDCAAEGYQSTCLGWSEGYCAIKNCGTGTGFVACPDGAACMGIALDQPLCAQECADDSQCRVKAGYACKPLKDMSGAFVRICHQVTTPGQPGDGCEDASDCAGAQGCLVNFTGGYCAVERCGADAPCPDGTRCVLLSGAPVCLKSCVADGDCQVAGNLPRGCIELRDAASGDKVGVCGSSAKGGPIGSQCLNDTECASGKCLVAVTGVCSQSDVPCNTTSQRCDPSEICNESPGKTFGYCTADCSNSKLCTGQALCVETLGTSPSVGTAHCMPGCTPDTGCRAEAGLECRYGNPLANPGRYACVALGRGEVGTDCTADADCNSGFCLHGSGDAKGYCSIECNKVFQVRCPFPTACGTYGGKDLCLTLCGTDQSCPGVTACSTDTVPVCLP